MLNCKNCKKELNKWNFPKHKRVCDIITKNNLYKIYSDFHNIYNYEINWVDYITKFGISDRTFSKYRRSMEIPKNKMLDFRPLSKETIEKLKKNTGGYRKGSGRGKGGWYKDYYCDSTYELCWLIYQLDHNIKPIRNDKGYEYEFKGKKHKYYPDFIVDNIIYEIKGFETEKDLFKYPSVKDKKLIILKKQDLKDVFEYVNEKYGKDYISLYEKTKHKKKEKIYKKDNCVCGNIKWVSSKQCVKCGELSLRTIERPPYEQLLKEIENTNYSAVGRKYNVSSTSIKKWIKYYEKENKC